MFGLLSLHLNCFFHGDIKPKNILISINEKKGSENYKLADFGESEEVKK